METSHLCQSCVSTCFYDSSQTLAARRPCPIINTILEQSQFKAVLRVPDGALLEGNLPSRQMKLVQAWMELHQDELMADWPLASAGQPLQFGIDKLEHHELGLGFFGEGVEFVVFFVNLDGGHFGFLECEIVGVGGTASDGRSENTALP